MLSAAGLSGVCGALMVNADYVTQLGLYGTGEWGDHESI